MTAWGAPPPVVIDLGKSDTRKVLLGGSVAGILGILALVGAVTAFVDGEPVGGSIAAVIGIAFTGIGVMAVVKWKTISRPRKLIVEQQGIRLDDPQGMPWAVGWQELGAISISGDSLQIDSGLPAATVNILMALVLIAVFGFASKRQKAVA